MADQFVYQPLDLEHDSSFRLIRLLNRISGPVQCESFHAYTYDGDDVVTHKAFSYTWEDVTHSRSIHVNGRVKAVIRDLSYALEHLRNQHEDQIPWISTPCVLTRTIPQSEITKYDRWRPYTKEIDKLFFG